MPSTNAIGSKVQNMIVGVIMAVILLAVGIALGPTVIAEAAKINATSMADVYLGTVITLISQFIAFFYYLGVALGAIMMVWGASKFG